ncbi:MAG: 3-dehydroquinate synthase [Anaerolineales bacterium]|nr:3-dehydroquinate synthase [Anaerolineales bacterium]
MRAATQYPFANLVLTGFMGTGKTTVGRLLARALGWVFVDTDAWIVERAGISIADMFAEDGGARFRQWESLAALTLSQGERQVIATGGRLMLDPANAFDLGRRGLTLCLAAPPAEIVRRISLEEGRRPLLDVPDPAAQVERLLQQRAAAYGRFPQVDTAGKTAAAIAAEILNGLAQNRWSPTIADTHELTVHYPDGSYDVVVGRGLLPRLRQWVTGPAALVTDSNVGPLHAARCGLETVIALPAGEVYKRLETVRGIYDALLAANMDRHGAVVALGGGVVGDMAGFAAATFMRGMGFAPCPTTLLAMVDASVGGKTGVDLPQGKNLVGAFKQPNVVLADVETLETLPRVEFNAGMSEVVKHGLLASPALLQQATLITPDSPDLPSLILRAIQVKQQIVERDPFESGQRAILNLGHTFGHAIEQVSQYRVRHGEAVAMGLVAAADLSARLGHADAALPAQIESLLRRLGLPTRIPPSLPVDDLFAAMGRDKKKRGNALRFILLRAIGDAFITDDAPATAVKETLRILRRSN